MRLAFRYRRATLTKLWAWRRAGGAIIGPLAELHWQLAHTVTPPPTLPTSARDGAPTAGPVDTAGPNAATWVVSTPFAASEWQRFAPTVEALDGVEWQVARDGGDVVELVAVAEARRPDAATTAVRMAEENVVGPLDAFLLVVPWAAEPPRLREVLVAVRGQEWAQRIVEDLCFGADTTVLEGVRSATGIAGPWESSSSPSLSSSSSSSSSSPSPSPSKMAPMADPTVVEDHWFRLSEPPYFLLRRWMDSPARPGQVPPRLFVMVPPTGPGRPHLWVAWGYEPALVQDQEFDPAHIADSLVVVGSCEPVRLLPTVALRPLAERISPIEADRHRPRIDVQPGAPTPIEIALEFRPRTVPVAGKIWRLTEHRLRDEQSWYERLSEGSRKNLQFAACLDRAGNVMLFLTEKVLGRSVADLEAIAEPLAEVPGLANCFLAGGFHLVPEIGASTLAPLIYRAADSAGVSKWWSHHDQEKLVPEQLEHLAEVGAEISLPMAILLPESVSAAVGESGPASAPAAAAAGDLSEVDDPWAMVMDEPPPSAPISVPSRSESGARWTVYFLPRSHFQSFERVGTMLLRHAQPRLRELQQTADAVFSPKHP